MANLITLSEPEVDTLSASWTGLEIWHATSSGGVYSLLVQIPYVGQQTTYTYVDSAGLASDWYEVRRYAPGPSYGTYSAVWAVTVDTLTLLQLKSTFWEFLDELYQGTATGGSAAQLVDTGLIGYTSETWPTGLEGRQICMTSGLAVRNLRQVGKVDRSNGIVIPNRQFSAAVAATDTYELWGNCINGGSPLTNLFNAVMRGLQPITDTQVTVVTNQQQYSLEGIAQSRRDITGVYLRSLDPAGLVPYRIYELVRGLDWDAYDRGGAGTPTVTLDLSVPRTLDATTEQLWVRATTRFTPFSVDTDSVAECYRDWLAWEAIYEMARRKLALGSSDRTRWTALVERATQELRSWRARWLPREPVRISTWA